MSGRIIVIHGRLVNLGTPIFDRRAWRWLVAASVGVVACQQEGRTTASAGRRRLAPITLALNWVPEPEFGGFYAAREGGAYKKAGLDVDIQGGGAGVPVVQMVATGRADFGTVSADELILARARGGDVVAVFATFQTAPHGIMVHAVARPHQARGRLRRRGRSRSRPGCRTSPTCARSSTGAAPRSSPTTAAWRDFLADPTFGQQCYVTSEPIIARQKGGDPQVFLIADAGFNPYTTIVITRRRADPEQSRDGAGVRRRDRRKVGATISTIRPRRTGCSAR